MKMFTFQSKITCHTNSQVLKVNEKQSGGVNTKLTVVLELSDKDFKAASMSNYKHT